MVLETFIPWAEQFILQFSYLAVFAISVLSSATVFLPLPLYVVIFFAAGLGLNPLAVGIIAGLGNAVGEIFSYLIGVGGRYVASEKEIVKKSVKKSGGKVTRYMKKFAGLYEKYGFWIIVLTAFLPFPFDFIGILSGATKYDIKKFFIAVVIGKTAKTLIISYAGYLTIPFLSVFLVTA
jgi:membrane protein DedA with SNARE-associated domain